jgi:hypothetical protein
MLLPALLCRFASAGAAGYGFLFFTHALRYGAIFLPSFQISLHL